MILLFSQRITEKLLSNQASPVLDSCDENEVTHHLHQEMMPGAEDGWESESGVIRRENFDWWRWERETAMRSLKRIDSIRFHPSWFFFFSFLSTRFLIGSFSCDSHSDTQIKDEKGKVTNRSLVCCSHERQE